MKRIFVDMDGVLCDFYGAVKRELSENPDQKYPQSKWGFFLKLQEIPNAVNSIKTLQEKYDVWILTRPSQKNVNCFTEKAQWVWDHLGFDMLKKMVISSDKSIVKGDYLIDDQNNANQDKFDGEWIHFKSDKFPNWLSVTKYLMGDLDKQGICDGLLGSSREDALEKYKSLNIRIFYDNGSKIPLERDINYSRLNLKIENDIITYAYFG